MKAMAIKTFFRTYIFKKNEIVRNPIWLSVNEQWNQLAWDGSSVAKFLDSIINVAIRLLVLLATFVLLPVGLLSMCEQLFNNILIETSYGIKQKQGINLLSSTISIAIAAVFWFVSFLCCSPFFIVVALIKMVSLRNDEKGKFSATIFIILLVIIFAFIYLLIKNSQVIFTSVPWLILSTIIFVSILGLIIFSLKGKNLSSSLFFLIFLLILAAVIYLYIYPNWNSIIIFIQNGVQ